MGQTTRFSPATVKAADQIAAFLEPETEPGRFDFGYEQPAESQSQRMLVDAYFDQATLADDTARTLASLGVQVPHDAGKMSYLTEVSANGVCSTVVKVESADSGDPRRSVQFSQGQFAPSDRHRFLDVTIAGAPAMVTLSSSGSFSTGNKSPCEITLRAGNWEQKMAGFLPVKFQVPAGVNFRLKWEASTVQPAGFPTSGPPLPLIQFGRGLRQSFLAREVRVLPSQLTAGAEPSKVGLVAQSERKDAPLTVGSFLIGTDQIQFGASGKGRVRENGSAVTTVNVMDAINKYPLIAALFGAANLGLLNWAKRKFFPPVRGVTEVVPFPKEPDDKAESKAASG